MNSAMNFTARSAVVLGACLSALAAHADLVYLPGENTLYQGSGLGSVGTVLTLNSPGNSSTESGAVFASGTGFATSGDAMTGASQVSLPTLGSLSIGDTSSLRIVLNANEPAGNSITIANLGLTFYDAVGAASMTFGLAAPVVIASTLNGIGQSGFVFGLDAAQAAAAASFLAASSTSFADFRVGLAATLTDATGGPDSFFVTAAPVPEPETYALLLAGLGVVGFVARRRRQYID
jgi:hypothetical protein